MAKVKGEVVEVVGTAEKMKPTLYLSDTDADMVGPVTVGDEVTVSVTAKVVSVSERTSADEDGKEKSHQSVELEIQSLSRENSGAKRFAERAQRAGKGAKG
jgi:hypothetical protein